MNWFPLLFLVILIQEGDCCLKLRPTVQPQCTCPDFRGLMAPGSVPLGGNVSIIDEGGCDRKMICGKHYATAVLFKFSETEISPPSDINSDHNSDQWLRTTTDMGWYKEPGPAFEFFDYFGIICENNAWYATKASLGFQYFTNEGTWKGSGNAGELEGKKTKIDLFSCIPPASAACTCPDIRELVDPRDETTVTSMAIDTVPFTTKDGCVTSITCGTHIWTWIRTFYNESEITPPDDIYDTSDYVNIDAVATGKWNDPPGYSIDMFSYFGLICENNEWYATKYPVGIEYFGVNDIKRFGENGELDGKKSKVKKIFCMLPGDAPTLPPVTTPAVKNLCDKCEIDPILANLENGLDMKPSYVTEIGQDGCIETHLRCIIENAICDSMQVYAKTATETIAIGNDDTIVSDATITCQSNGKYGFGTVKDIESFIVLTKDAR